MTARYLVAHGLPQPKPAVVPVASASGSAAPRVRASPGTVHLGQRLGPVQSAVPLGLGRERLVSGAIRVRRAVCNAFPQIGTYLQYYDYGEHATGKAIGVMVFDPALGYQIEEFLQTHASKLDLYGNIYRKHIWTRTRASEGWRLMPARGSATANTTTDHV